LDWDAATKELQAAGFNTMYVNLASAGGAFYPGSLAVPSIVSGNGDTLAKGIAVAHRRGIAVHAKFIVMFAFKAAPEFQQRMIKANRVLRGSGGQVLLQSGNFWLCPSQMANRKQAIATITETLRRYPVDGAQFDYIRFFEEPSCYCASCRKAAASAGVEFNEWRQGLITEWARDLSAAVRAARPGIPVSAAVFPSLDRAREEKAQNWKLWVDRGYLDYVCTMNYVTGAKEFDARNQSTAALVPRAKIVAGIGSWKLTEMAALQGQIGLTRQAKLAGFALFSYDDAESRRFLPTVSSR
jgi:uncharacterized lipoprotein YddW (UPF0748 family)